MNKSFIRDGIYGPSQKLQPLDWFATKCESLVFKVDCCKFEKNTLTLFGIPPIFHSVICIRRPFISGYSRFVIFRKDTTILVFDKSNSFRFDLAKHFRTFFPGFLRGKNSVEKFREDPLFLAFGLHLYT